MADPREFILIGRFDDGITPQLAKINNQLAQLKQTFSNIGGRGARTASRDLGKFNAAVEGLSNTLKIQNKVLSSTIEPMRQYRREVGKTVGALKKLDEAGGRSIAIERTNRALQEQIRLMDQLRGRSARGGLGGGYVPPRAPRGMSGVGGGGAIPPRGGGGTRPSYGSDYAGAVAGSVIGNQLASYAESGIVAGFRIGVGLMEAPFRYFANALSERIGDELSDIQAAGGLLAVAKRQKDPFVKSFNESVRFTQEMNARFADIAAALPGNTQQYIEVGKRLSDTAARIVANDVGKAIKEANVLRAERGETAISATGRKGQQQAIKELLGELTTQTVLAGMGGGGGAGRTMGAYGLPQLTERMVGQDEVTMGQFQRYAAIFRDPAMQQALERYIPEINQTQKNTVERFKVLRRMYQEILPPEVIRAYERSLEGIKETYMTAFMNPETGLFGIGRKLTGIAKAMNQYGQYIKVLEDGTEKVVKSAAEADTIDLSLFDLFRDIVANIGVVLGPIVQNLTFIFDPLRKIAEGMVKAREATGKFLYAFESYRQGLTEFADKLPKGQQKEFAKIDINLRASLAAINNLFRGLGLITKEKFDVNAKEIMSTKFDFAEMMREFVNTLMNSELAKQIGEFLGNLVGTVLSQTANILKNVAQAVEGGGFAGGFASAFQKSGGFQAIQDIFVSLVQMFVKALGVALLKMPLVVGGLAALTLLPAIIGSAVAEMVQRMMTRCMGAVSQDACPLPNARGGGTRGGRGSGTYQGRPQRYGRGGSIERLNRMRRARMARGVRGAGANMAYAAEPFVNYAKTSRIGQGAAGLAKGAGRLARGAGRMIPGGALAAGAIDMGIAMASGENFGKAAIGAIGTVLGATAGSVFGPVGTAIGATLGGTLANASSDFILGAIDQNHAAKLQMEAAQKQVDAAASAAQQKYGPDFGAQLGGVEALNQALGGGAGVKAYAEEQLRLGNILPEQAQSWDILGTQLTDVNKTTAAVEKAQKAYDNAVKLNTGEQKKYKDMLEKAKGEQERALSRISANWESMSATNRTKLLGAADGIVDALNGAAAKIRGWRGIPGVTPAPPPRKPTLIPPTTDTPVDKPPAQRNQAPGYGSGVSTTVRPLYNGGLGDAIASEMRMKPPGSDLVIANSSETVIPAAGGYGMKAFLDTLGTGFTAVKNQMQMLGQGIQTADANSQKRDQQTNTKLTDYHNQTQSQILKLSQNVSSLSQQVATMSSMGGMGGMGGGLFGAGMGGAGVGKVVAVGKMLQGMGLNVAENPAFGTGRVGKHAPGSYHYSGRAIDVTGSDAQLDAAYAKLKAMGGYAELLWRTAGHYDHLHVAYALGQGNPAFFSSQRAAESWEASMAGRMNVRTVTGNTMEGFGGHSVGDIYVTVHAGATNDPDQLAYMVAERIQAAVGDAVNANILV